MLSLTFGVVINSQAGSAPNNMMYAFIVFFLLWVVENNQCSIDRLIRRKP